MVEQKINWVIDSLWALKDSLDILDFSPLTLFCLFIKKICQVMTFLFHCPVYWIWSPLACMGNWLLFNYVAVSYSHMWEMIIECFYCYRNKDLWHWFFHNNLELFNWLKILHMHKPLAYFISRTCFYWCVHVIHVASFQGAIWIVQNLKLLHF